MKSNAKAVFKRLKLKFDKAILDAPKALANEGVKQFVNNFETQSFEGNKWKEVQRREPGTFAYKYPKSKGLSRRTRPILIGKTRRLRNATKDSIKHASTRRIRWANSTDYGVYLNEERPFMKTGRKFSRALKMKYYSILKRVK